jgi:cellulose biosynthesis protein BcsE
MTPWSWLQSRFHFGESRQLRWQIHDVPVPTLALEGVPLELTVCQPKHVYAVLAPPSAALRALLLYSLLDGLDRPAVWISAHSGADMLELAEQFGIDLGEERSKRHLTLFSLDHRQPEGPRQDLAHLVLELERYRLPRGGLLVLEGCDDLCDWNDPAALRNTIRWLHDWARRQAGRVLWVVDPGGGERSMAIHHLQHQFGGIAQLVAEHGELIWKMDLWKTGPSIRLGEIYPLRFNQQGRLTLLSRQEGGQFIAVDETRVLALSGVVAGEPWYPEHWELFSEPASLLAACEGVVAATVLFDCRFQRDIEPLLHAVYDIRQRCGNKVKILVREIGQVMRYQYESLFLSVGANQVVGRDANFSRFLAIVHAVQGQVLTRVLPADFNTALTRTLKGGQSGYLPPAEFVSAMREAFEGARMINVNSVLLKLPLWPHVSHLDALGQCQLTRPGDICTADENVIYLFLYACQVPDIVGVLRRVFSDPVDELFVGQLQLTDEVSIYDFLDEFERGIADRVPVDHTQALAELAKSRAPVTVAEAPAAKPVAAAASVTAPEPAGGLAMLEHALLPHMAQNPRQVSPCVLPLRAAEGGEPA